MNKSEYFKIVKRWEEEFGKPDFGMFHYDPTTVKAGCAKCHQRKLKSARHHKANDFFFALWFPHWFAARYIQFHKDDCDRLCEGCHKKCHAYFAGLAAEMYLEFDERKELVPLLTEESWKVWAEDWKVKFLKMYTRWISQPLRRRKKHKKTGLTAKREEK